MGERHTFDEAQAEGCAGDDHPYKTGGAPSVSLFSESGDEESLDGGGEGGGS